MNRLYYGDNLEILRNYIADESIDLIYIDPPFNSNRAYNVIFREADGSASEAQIQAFEDTWRWGKSTEQAYHDLVVTAPPHLVETIKSFRGFLTETNLMAYLVMVALRLVELHRVLKPTGSFYLHCDPTASPYLRVLLDTLFEPVSFRNELTWKRQSAHSDAKRYARVSDTILFYTKSNDFTWNNPKGEYSEQYLKTHYNQVDRDRRRFRYSDLGKPKGSRGYFYNLLGCPPPPNGWRMPEDWAKQWLAEGRIEIPPKGKIPAYKRYLDEMEGSILTNVWTDIPSINSQAKERLGYPTQKPEALLNRIIKASSNEGDTVLDAFCGCGTTLAVAQRLKRQWIGIDITHLAIAIMKYRLRDAFGDEVKYEIIGEPKDEASAQVLAQQNRYQFQWWALSLIKARPYQGKKKGADEGIDGVIYFQDLDLERPNRAMTQKIIVQVKSGHVSVRDIRELKAVVESQKGVIGVFVTLEAPTGPMLTEAVTAGTFQRFQAQYPKIQIRTIKELLEGHGIEYPQTTPDLTFKKAERHNPAGEQLELM